VRLAGKSPSAMAGILRAVDAAGHVALDRGLELETELATAARMSPDGMEGVRAFFEKRPPRFRGYAPGGDDEIGKDPRDA
jgi:enoyl-CoA hydratase/carnithine racemase